MHFISEFTQLTQEKRRNMPGPLRRTSAAYMMKKKKGGCLMREKLAQIERLKMRYGTVNAVTDVSFELYEERFWH